MLNLANVIKLLIIEAHPAVRRALAFRLQSHPNIEVVAVAQSLPEGVQQAQSFHPDAILWGLQRQSKEAVQATIDGIGTLNHAKAAVIVLTSYAEDLEREVVLNNGAHRYLLKDINTPQLITEIEAAIEEARVTS